MLASLPGIFIPEDGRPPWRLNQEVQIPIHLPIYLDDASWPEAFLFQMSKCTINHDPNSIMHSVTFRLAEMQVQPDTYICAICRGLWPNRTFEHHPCTNQQIVFTSSFYSKWDSKTPNVMADAVTALKLVKPGADAGRDHLIKIYNLLSEFIIYLFFTCRDFVQVDMHRIMTEGLLAAVTVSPERHQAIVQILTTGSL